MEKRSRIKSVSSNFIWASCNAAVSSVFPFIVRTLLIYRIGLEYSGVSNLFSSVLQVLNIANLGIENAIIFYLYKPLEENDLPTIRYFVRLLRKVYRIIGLFILAAGLALIPAIPYLVRDQEYPEGLNLYFIYIVYIINSAWVYLTTGYKSSLLRADQHFDLVSIAGCIAGSSMYILQIISLAVFRDYYLYTILLLVCPILNTFLYDRMANRRYPELFSKEAQSKKDDSCELKNDPEFYSGFRRRLLFIGLAKVRNTSRSSFDSIVISAFVGLTMLAKYQNYYQVMLLPITLLGVIRGAMSASFGNSIVTESRKTNFSVLKTYSFFMSGFITVCMSCLLNMYQPFITIWLGEEYLLSFSIVIILCVYFYLLCISDINEMLKETTGIWEQEKVLSVVEALANLILNVLLVQNFGVEGVLLATIITLLFINIPFEFSYLFRHYFRQYGLQYFALQLVYALITLVISFISYEVCSRILVTGIFTLMVRLLVAVVVPLALFLIFHCRDREFGNLISMLKELRSE